MPISISKLQQEAARISVSYDSISLEKRFESLSSTQHTAFLCHSHKDENLAKALQSLLAKSGWNLYVDWQDAEMPETPNIYTARNIKRKISEKSWFLFLATQNSCSSRWCPWEIGIADGIKNNDEILIIPTKDSFGKFYGNEYLQLYGKIDEKADGALAKFVVGKSYPSSF